MFPPSATECLNTGEGKMFVKVGVDFPTGEAMQNMKDFNYAGSEDVLALMVSTSKDVA